MLTPSPFSFCTSNMRATLAFLAVFLPVFACFIIVTPTFKRDNIVGRFLHKYAVILPQEMPELEAIYIVWANLERSPFDSPIVMKDKDNWKVPVHFHIPPTTSLNYRFYLPEGHPDDSPVFSLDDDLGISTQDIRKAFEAWKAQTSPSIVGYTPRSAKKTQGGRLRYVYNTHGRANYSMVLTNAAFISPVFIRAYNNVKDDKIAKMRLIVDEQRNGEDIGMNFVAKQLGNPTLVCVSAKVSEDAEASLNGISYGKSHDEKRNLCLNEFARIFGFAP